MRTGALKTYLIFGMLISYFYVSIPEIKHPYLQLTKLNTTCLCLWLHFKWGLGIFEGVVTSSSLSKMKEKKLIQICNNQIVRLFVLQVAHCSISVLADGKHKQGLGSALDTSADVKIVCRQFLMWPKNAIYKCTQSFHWYSGYCL